MDFTLLFKAAIMGIVEGLTEFLPVSSTGHLIITSYLINFDSGSGKFFEILIQLGAILAICILYAKKFLFVATHLKSDRESRKFVYNIGLAFAPAVVLGVALHDIIKKFLFSPYTVAIALIIGGVIIILAERVKVKARYFSVEGIPYKKALAIGIIQCLAMIPGVSRSGATIISARLFGTTRRAAAEFSFFLAIPTITGASVYDIYKNYKDFDASMILTILVGFAFAFVTGLIVVRIFLNYIKKHSFAVFGWYRIVAGIALLALILSH